MSVLGVDSSTGGAAWTLIEHGEPLDYGKINTTKIKNIEDKLATLSTEFDDLLMILRPQFVVIEKSIYVNNRATFRTLSYVVGALMATAKLNGCRVYDVEPLSWKAELAYTPITTKMILSARRTLDRATAVKVCDGLKKEQTYNVIKYNFPAWDPAGDYDIADSTGIALWGWNHLIQPLDLKKSKEIALGDKYGLFY